jgi:hypothetical protein
MASVEAIFLYTPPLLDLLPNTIMPDTLKGEQAALEQSLEWV